MTNEEKAEWTQFLRDMDVDRRDRFARQLAAAPARAGDKAYTLTDLRLLGADKDVSDSVEAVPGFRLADVRYFMQYWRAHTGAVETSNAPVVEARAAAAATAAAARNDSPAAAAAAVARSVREAHEDADDLEGKSAFCYALFRLKSDSSKIGVVAKSGAEPEENEYVFTEKGVDINTVEWRAHLKSRDAWMEYTRDLKKVCRTHGRAGLISRITEFNDYLDEIGDWNVCAEYIPMYMREFQGRLKVPKDTESYLKALRN